MIARSWNHVRGHGSMTAQSWNHVRGHGSMNDYFLVCACLCARVWLLLCAFLLACVPCPAWLVCLLVCLSTNPFTCLARLFACFLALLLACFPAMLACLLTCLARLFAFQPARVFACLLACLLPCLACNACLSACLLVCTALPNLAMPVAYA